MKEKGNMKSVKAWTTLLFTSSLILFASALSAVACTGFYVGRKVSADGTTLIGRTVDAAPWNGPMREARFERGEWTHADGTKNKYAFICASKVTSQGEGLLRRRLDQRDGRDALGDGDRTDERQGG